MAFHLKQIIARFQEARKRLISGFARDGIPATEEEYRAHYRSFDAVPFSTSRRSPSTKSAATPKKR